MPPNGSDMGKLKAEGASAGVGAKYVEDKITLDEGEKPSDEEKKPFVPATVRAWWAKEFGEENVVDGRDWLTGYTAREPKPDGTLSRRKMNWRIPPTKEAESLGDIDKHRPRKGRLNGLMDGWTRKSWLDPNRDRQGKSYIPLKEAFYPPIHYLDWRIDTNCLFISIDNNKNGGWPKIQFDPKTGKVVDIHGYDHASPQLKRKALKTVVKAFKLNFPEAKTMPITVGDDHEFYKEIKKYAKSAGLDVTPTPVEQDGQDPEVRSRSKKQKANGFLDYLEEVRRGIWSSDLTGPS
jgi:hypothetical protein